MASNMSNYLEGNLIGYLFRTQATFAKPTVIAVALSTSTTTDATTGSSFSEPATANGYVRANDANGTGNTNPLDANWAAISGNNGTTSNTNALTWPANTTADWGTITDVVICDDAARVTGNAWFYGALTVAKPVSVGDIFKFNANQLVVQIDS